MTRGKGFLSLKKFEQKSPISLLFGVSHSMHGTFQVMKSPTYMELRMFESGLQIVLYFKVWITPLYHPWTSVVWNKSQGKKINTMRGSCIYKVQKDAPTLLVNKTSGSLYNCLLHRWVIKRGIANTWGIWGCANQSSLITSTTVYIAAGWDVQSIGLYYVCN